MTNEEIIIKVTEHDGQIGRHEGRIKLLEKEVNDIRDLTTSVKLLAEKQEQTNTNIERTNKKMDKIADDVEFLKTKPARRWELVVSEIIRVIAATGAGYLLAMLINQVK